MLFEYRSKAVLIYASTMIAFAACAGITDVCASEMTQAEMARSQAEGWGGPGGGGSGIDIGPITGWHSASTRDAARDSTLRAASPVMAWFDQLTAADRRKFLIEATKVGVVAPDGKPFEPGQFWDMAAYLNATLTRGGMSDAEKLVLIRMMQQDAGIDTPQPSGLRARRAASSR